jgi:hypothetical protein
MGIKVILFADDQGAISKDEENVQGAFRILSRRTDSCNFKISTNKRRIRHSDDSFVKLTNFLFYFSFFFFFFVESSKGHY